jgi:hypothetical protein
MISKETQKAIIDSQISEYEAARYRLELQAKIAKKAHDQQAQILIDADLMKVELALDVLNEELKMAFPQ